MKIKTNVILIKTNVNHMNYSSLFKYIKSIVNDDYAMEVLYFHLKSACQKHNFTLDKVSSITISKKYLKDEIKIYINNKYSNEIKTIALLLSFRAIMLNKMLINLCDDDFLIFTDYTEDRFGWMTFHKIILDLQSDKEFYELYKILEELKFEDKISIDSREKFKDRIHKPDYRNLINYYHEIACTASIIKNEVICNNAYAFDNTISELTIPYTIEYIGHTAFAYCENLTKIIFEKKDTLFGKFPIIECNNLKSIIVPEGTEDYYKQILPYYKDIISHNIKEKTEEIINMGETISEENINKLYATLNDKTTTYKFFWFLSILSFLKEREEMTFTYKDLTAKMLSLAWPYIEKNIDFGTTDKFKSLILNLIGHTRLRPQFSSNIVYNFLSKNHNQYPSEIVSSLIANVPYSFLFPWIKDIQNSEIMKKSQSPDYSVPYAIYEDCISIDETWVEYFRNNYLELSTYTKKALHSYLKTRNSDFKLLSFLIET